MKRAIILAALLCSFVLAPTDAFSAWSAGSDGTGRAVAISIGLPTSTSASSTGPTSIHIAWAAPGGASATPTQYVVRRTAPSTATVCTVTGVVFACDDAGLTGATTYTYTVEAKVGSNWTSGQTTGFSATTSAANFLVSLVAGSKIAGTAFTATITATTNGVTTDVAYAGVKTLAFSGPASSPSGQAPTYPATVTFVDGVGSASVTLYKVETATLSVTDGTRTGTVSVTVVAGAANRLGYTSSSLSCALGSVVVGNGGSFTSKVTVYDAWLNPVTEAVARTINLTKNTGIGTLAPVTLTIPIAASETSVSFTFTLPSGNPPDTTVTAASAGVTSTNCIVKKT